MEPGTIELLAPAKDLFCGIAAIEHGADAVYIGAPRFSARAAAANSLEDIGTLINFAHQFHARVYIALNTVLGDDELDEAVKMIHHFHELGADAIIIQDMGLLECDLPPIPLHASTQVNNRTVEKVHFLEKVGFQQVVLARELSLAEIERISQQTSIALECFVHGALCVSYSGQCYISEVMAGRSANRGNCAQFCRHKFTLKDATGKIIEKDKHLLSLKDLNLSKHLRSLITAGIRSFKIEGRLKDSNYVKNITALYRQQLDLIIDVDASLKRASSGRCNFSFMPDAEKSFNRGETQYFLQDRRNRPASIDTPKSIGKKLGRVGDVGRDSVDIVSDQTLHNGDGLCYFDQQNNLVGFSINRVEGKRIYPHKNVAPAKGTLMYRNHDVRFNRLVAVSEKCRKVDVKVLISQTETGLSFLVTDEDKIKTTCTVDVEKVLAKNPELTHEALRRQAGKSGETIFNVVSIVVEINPTFFYPPTKVKELRRRAFDAHQQKRVEECTLFEVGIEPNNEKWPGGENSYLNNILNSRAESFYLRHGAVIANGKDEPVKLMSCKYCIKAQLGFCPEMNGEKGQYQEPLSLGDKAGDYNLSFNCKNCEMILKKR